MTDLERVGRTLRADRKRLEASMRDAERAALVALNAGATEVAVAKILGVNRMTVRKWRGKR